MRGPEPGKNVELKNARSPCSPPHPPTPFSPEYRGEGEPGSLGVGSLFADLLVWNVGVGSVV